MPGENRIEIRLVATGADQAAAVLKSVAAAGAQIGTVVSSGATQAETAMARFGTTAKQVFTIFTGVSLSNIILDIAAKLKSVADQAWTVAENALRGERAFQGMTQAMGIQGDQLLAKLEKIGRGLVDQHDLMRASAQALQVGLNPEQLTRIMDIAVDRARVAGKSVAEAYGDIALAVAENRTRMLKDYGIVIDTTEAYKDFAKVHGTVAEALTETGKAWAVYDQMMKQVEAHPRLAPTDDELDRIDRFRVRYEEFLVSLGRHWVDAVGAMLSYFDQQTARMKTSDIEWADWIKNSGSAISRFWNWLKSGGQGVFRNEGWAPPSTPYVPGAAESEWTAQETKGLRPGTVAPSPKLFDEVKTAVGLADKAIQLLNARLQAGVITQEEFAQGLETAIAKLAAFGKTADPEVTLKLLTLQGQLLKVREEMAKLAEPEAIASLRATVPGALEGWMVTAERAAQSEAALGEWQTAMALAAQQAEALGLTVGEKLAKQITVTQTALEKQSKQFGTSSEAAKRFADELVNLRAQQDALAKATEPLATSAEADTFKETADRSARAAAALGEWQTAMAQIGLEAKALGTSVGDTLAQKIAVTEAAIRRLTPALGENSKEIQEMRADVDAWKAQAFDQALADIDVKAKLLGPDFDVVAEKVELTKARLLEMAAASKGEVTPEIEALRQSLANLVDYQKTKALFTDLFSSIGDTFSQMVSGVLTGTQTIGDAFKRLAQNIIVNFVNRIIQEALNPLVKAAAAAVAGLLSPSGAAAEAVGSTWTDQAGNTYTLAGGGGTATTGGVGGGYTFINPTALQNIWTGATNIGANWAAGGLSGVMLGTTGGTGVEAMTSLGLGGIGEVTSTQGFLGSGGSLSAGLSGFGAALAYAGAALEAFSIVTDFTTGKIEAGIGGTVGAVAGGVIGGYFLGPAGAALGVAVGGWLGELIGGLFGGGISHYEEVRKGAREQASAGIQALYERYQAGLMQGTSEGALQALSTTEAGGHVYTILQLPPSIAERVGVTGPEVAGGKIQVEWSALSVAQFEKFIDLFAKTPGAESWVVGSGDVGYLPGGEAEQVAGQAQTAAVSLVRAVNEILTFNKAVDSLGSKLETAAKTVLSPEIAGAIKTGLIDPLTRGMKELLLSGKSTEEIQTALKGYQTQAETVANVIDLASQMTAQFTTTVEGAKIALSGDLYDLVKANLLDPLSDKMTAILESGDPAETILKNLQALQAEQAAIASLIGAYATIDEEIASMSGNMALLREHMVAVYEANVTNFGEAITKAMTRLDEATGDINTTAAEEAELVKNVHDAVIARYQYEIQMVQAIEAEINRLLDTYGTKLTSTKAALAAFAAESGDFGAVGVLWTDLKGLAETSKSTAQQVWALVTGLEVVAAIAPSLGTSITEATIGEGGAIDLTGPTQIWGAIVGAAYPFLDKFTSFISDAIDAGDYETALSLTQQQGEAIAANAKLAVAEVEKWGDAALAASKKVRDAEVDAIKEQGRLDILAVETRRDKELAAYQTRLDEIDAERTAISDAADQRRAALEEEIAAVQDQIALTQEWEQQLDSIRTMITDLLLGPSSSLSGADRLLLAQERERTAMAEARRLGTPEAAAAAQTAAQDLLSAASEAYAGQPGAYQTVFEGTLADLRALEGFVGGKIGTPSEVLQQRLDDLNATSSEIAETEKQQLAALDREADLIRGSMDAVKERADIDVETINTRMDTEIEAADARQAERDAAITETVTTAVEGIKTATVAALTANATLQNNLLTILIGGQLDTLNQITGGMPAQDFIAMKQAETVTLLGDIKLDIETWLQRQSTPSYQTGTLSARGGLSILEPGEVVLNPAVSRAMRSGAWVGVSGATGGGSSVTFTLAPGAVVVKGADDPEETGRAVVKAVERWAKSARGQAIVKGNF